MKKLPMRMIRDVLYMSAEGLWTRQIAASLSIGRTTLQGFLERARDAVLSWSLPPEMPVADLERLTCPRTARSFNLNHAIGFTCVLQLPRSNDLSIK